MTDKRWQDKTRGGYPVRIYAEDAGGRYPIHGAILIDGVWKQRHWMVTGALYTEYENEHEYDLLPIKKKRRVFKTLDELASQYEIHIHKGGRIHITTDEYSIYSRSPYDTPECGSDPKWLEIFTKEDSSDD